MDTLSDRFWVKVDRRGPDECWEWQGARKQRGYGLIRPGGKRASMLVASRVSWMLNVGPIPDGLQVLHRCDNPPCVNPAHLFLGTNLDNMADKVAKGRSHAPQPKKRGERHPMAKLTTADVAVIRATPKTRGSGVALAERYGVSTATICNIRKGKVWTEVAPAPTG